MSIKINLLAEMQEAEEMRRSDPVKRSFWIGGFLFSLALLWCIELQLDLFFANSAVKRAADDWTRLEPAHKEVSDWVARTELVQTKLAALDRLSTNRILWANILNSLQKSIVEGVQVTRVKGDQTYSFIEAVPAKGKTLGVPASSTEKVTLMVEARDWNPEGQTYSQFKKSLSNSDYFLHHLARGDGFVLTALSGVSTDHADSKKESVSFTLECHFPEVRRDE